MWRGTSREMGELLPNKGYTQTTVKQILECISNVMQKTVSRATSYRLFCLNENDGDSNLLACICTQADEIKY